MIINLVYRNDGRWRRGRCGVRARCTARAAGSARSAAIRAASGALLRPL